MPVLALNKSRSFCPCTTLIAPVEIWSLDTMCVYIYILHTEMCIFISASLLAYIYIYINLNQIAKQIENLNMSDGTSSIRPGAGSVMSGSVYIYIYLYIYMCIYIYLYYIYIYTYLGT